MLADAGPWLLLATVAVTLVVAYLVFALMLGATVSGVSVSIGVCYLIVLAGALVVGVGLGSLHRRRDLPDLARPAIVLSAASVLVSLLAVDTFFDLREKRQGAAILAGELRRDLTTSVRPRPGISAGKNSDLQARLRRGLAYASRIVPFASPTRACARSGVDRHSIVGRVFRDDPWHAAVLALGDS